MKTILVPTDLSASANNAARYTISIAKVIGANIKLCHAFKVPVETYAAGALVWPLDEYDTLKTDLDLEFEKQAEALKESVNFTSATSAFKPEISFISEIGEMTDVVRNIFSAEKCLMTVMGTSGAGGLQRFLLGSSSRAMIETADFPLLLVPHDVPFKGIDRIAFATDLNDDDIQILGSLSTFARHFNAEIVVIHISDKKCESSANTRHVDEFLKKVSNIVNYHKIYYRHVKSMDISHGLDWVYEHGTVDMLAMTHNRRHGIAQLFSTSYTQKLAKHIDIPLLVYPRTSSSASLTVF